MTTRLGDVAESREDTEVGVWGASDSASLTDRDYLFATATEFTKSVCHSLSLKRLQTHPISSNVIDIYSSIPLLLVHLTGHFGG